MDMTYLDISSVGLRQCNPFREDLLLCLVFLFFVGKLLAKAVVVLEHFLQRGVAVFFRKPHLFVDELLLLFVLHLLLVKLSRQIFVRFHDLLHLGISLHGAFRSNIPLHHKRVLLLVKLVPQQLDFAAQRVHCELQLVLKRDEYSSITI